MIRDVSHAARVLLRDRRFSAVVVLVLALAIGGNTVVFSLVNAILLNPFPYPHAARLVEISKLERAGRRLIVSRGARLTSAGIVFGMPAALGAARLMTSLLYGVGPHDLLVFTIVPCLLLLVALLASCVPAYRAAAADPLASLRAD